MPEILTESFCERCGTRYTFEAVTPKARPLTKLKILTRGLRNYVLSDETTLDEALAAARSEEQREISAQQLDAFHKTFNFCMSCRQYTCSDCWNEIEGRCLTCGPDLRAERLAGPFPVVAAPPLRPAELAGSTADGRGHATGNGLEPPTIAASAWPTIDLHRETPTLADAGASGSLPETITPATVAPAPAVPTIDTPAELTVGEPVSGQVPELAPGTPGGPPAVAASAAPPASPIHEDTVTEQAAGAIARTTSLFARFRPAREHGQAAAAPATDLPAAAEATAESTADEPAGEAAATPVELAATPVDRIETPVWRIVAPDTAPEAGPATPPAPVAWPSPPAPPASPPAAAAAFASPPPVAADALWAASSRDVLNRPGSGVQACVSCGLPLSATARFCRRCGTRQG